MNLNLIKKSVIKITKKLLVRVYPVFVFHVIRYHRLILPFDENWVIESLSDSTIYMLAYTNKKELKNIY